MRFLIMLISLIALLWSVYWFVAAAKLKSETSKVIQSINTKPWSIIYSDLSIRGFPNRFDITINDLKIENTDLNISWSLPYFQILSLSYKPNHLIIAFPHKQILEKGQKNIIFNSTKMLASIIFEDYRFNKPSKFILDVENSELIFPNGTKLEATPVTFAIRTSKTKSNTYQTWIKTNKILITTPDNHSLERSFVWPQDHVYLEIDADIGFSKAIKNTNLPPITDLKIKAAEIRSSDITVRSTAELYYLTDGLPNGIISVNVQNWSNFFKRSLQKNGNLSDHLNFISKLTNDLDEFKLNFKIKKGDIFIGPILLGTTPALLNQ